MYILSCSDKKGADTPTGLLLMGYQSELSVIVDLPVVLKSITFTQINNQTHRATLNKTLQFAYLTPQFLSALPLPVGNYDSISLHLSMQDSLLRLFDRSVNDWVNAQIVSHDQLFVPQAKSDFFVELSLAEPLSIEVDKSALLQFNIDMKQTITPDPEHNNLIRFNPVFTTEIPTVMAIDGHIIEHTAPHDFTLLLDQEKLRVSSEKFFVNGKATDSFELSDVGHLKDKWAKLQVTTEEGALMVVSDSFGALTEDKYTGWLIATNDTFAVMGHRRGIDGQLTFVQAHALDMSAIKVFRESSAIASAELMAGQSVTFYESVDNSRLYLEPVTIEGQVLAVSDSIRIQPLTIDGKRYEQFGDDAIEISRMEQGDVSVGDVITFKGDLTTSQTIDSLSEEEVFPTDKIDLRMEFSPNNVALLFYEVLASDSGRLFFTDGLADVRIQATSTSGYSQVSLNVDEIHTTKDSTFKLSYLEGDLIKQVDIQNFTAFIEKITPVLNTHQQKLLALDISGSVDQGRFIADHLHLSLQYPVIPTAQNASDFWDKDIVSDLSTLHTDDIQLIVDNKAPIGAIVGATLGGVAAVAGVAGGIFLGLKKVAYDYLAPHGVIETFDYMGKPKITLLGTDNPQLAKKLPESVVASELIVLGSGKYLVNPNNRELLPWQWDDVQKKWVATQRNDQWTFEYDQTIVDGAKQANTRAQTVIPEGGITNLNFKEGVRIESNGDLYRYTLSNGTTLYLTAQERLDGSFAHFDGHLSVRYINDFLKDSPEDVRQKFYFGTTYFMNGYYQEPDNHSALFPSRKRPFQIGDLYRPDLARRDTAGPFKYWPVLDDARLKATMKFDGGYLDTLYDKEYGVDKRRNPEELRIIIQLENDEGAITNSVYRSYMRYPEHSILVQMNKNGDFRITNGVENLAKFNEEKYQGKVIWQPQGHGWEYTHGGNTDAQLAKNMEGLLNKLPEEASRVSDQKLRLTKKNIEPYHINMDGCSLGRSRWFTQSFMQKTADRFYKRTGLAPTYEAFARISTTTKVGVGQIHPESWDTGKGRFSNVVDLYEGKSFSSEAEAYRKAHKIYKPDIMDKPISSGAEDSYYVDPNGIRRRLFRGPIQTDAAL